MDAFRRASTAALLGLVITSTAVARAQPAVEIVSIRNDGTPGNGWSREPVMTGDGRFVAFQSLATDLVPGDTNGEPDVFVRDRATGDTTRISVRSNGGEASGWSFGPDAISEDGRYVLFTSAANDLVDNDATGIDLFLHDRHTGTTEMVAPGLRGNTRASISADGNTIAFESRGADPPANGGRTHIYVWQRQAPGVATITVASVSVYGLPANGASWQASISADGRYVAFLSSAALVLDDTNDRNDVYVRDLLELTTERVSVRSDGSQPSYPGYNTNQVPAISADGRFVAFQSNAVDLVPGDTNGASDVFVHDRVTATTTRVSVSSDGVEADTGSMFGGRPELSADGRYVAFTSGSTNLVAADANGSEPDVFVHDQLNGDTILVPYGPEAALYGRPVVISLSGDGGQIAFDRSLIGPVGTPSERQVWVADLTTPPDDDGRHDDDDDGRHDNDDDDEDDEDDDDDDDDDGRAGRR